MHIEEPTVVYTDIVNKSLLAQCKDFCKNFLQYPDDVEQQNNWYRKGYVHLEDFVINTVDPFIRPLIKQNDAILAGDTAFLVKYPPHDIHIDNVCDNNQIAYKTVVIPVHVEGNTVPKFYTTEQYYHHATITTRFRHGSEERDAQAKPIQYQKSNGIKFSYDYNTDGVKYLKEGYPISKEFYDTNIDAAGAVAYSNFKNLSIEAEHEWKPGNVIVFDSDRLHFSQNLKKINVAYKVGLSLNYVLPKR